ncbi:MAG TPA: flavodoxin family protein [Candidatus Omnitrophica bacterium]|nr:flavodoxin family protein [Candidatus Omnitrophota bacterium]
MYVLGINGSPREGGNCDLLLDRALDGARSKGARIEKIVLNRLKFVACQECANMPDDGSCIVDDDMQKVFEKIKMADAVILASPIFFGSLSAQTKMMIDRFQCLWRAKYILKNKGIEYKKKKGIFVCVEASNRDDFFQNARSIVKNLFATINTDYSSELFCSGVDNKASINTHPDWLSRAYELGVGIVS